MNLAKQAESILFSVGRRVEIEELAKLCRTDKEELKKALKELEVKYNSENSSLMLIEEGTGYKLTVKEEYLNLVRNVVSETELPKTLIETLAVIAWKAPLLQSKVIEIRTNKAYDHLKYLEEAGYITRQKHGRTRMIKLAQKFFDYFDLPKDKVKERFQKFENIEKELIQREGEVQNLKKEIEWKQQEVKKVEEEEANVEKGVKELFGEENAASEVPKVQKPDEVPAKKKQSR